MALHFLRRMIVGRPAKLAFLFGFDGMVLTEAVECGQVKDKCRPKVERSVTAGLLLPWGANPAQKRSRAQKTTVPVSDSEREREAVKRS